MRRLLALAALLWACTAQADGARELFAATLTGLDDQPVALAKWRGKPLIVNFWARWCGPCRAEIPELVLLRQRNLGKDLEVLGIAIEEKTEPVRDFARAYEMDYPVLLARDKGFALMKALGNEKLGLPFTVAIDRGGKLVAIKIGALKAGELAAFVQTALK